MSRKLSGQRSAFGYAALVPQGQGYPIYASVFVDRAAELVDRFNALGDGCPSLPEILVLMVEQSLLHITLNMNHRRRSPRSKVRQEAIDLLSILIQKSEFEIPGQATYRCDVFEPGGCRCSCFQVLDADGVSLVTFGVGLGETSETELARLARSPAASGLATVQ